LRRLVVRPPALRRRRARGITVTSGSTSPQLLVPRQGVNLPAPAITPSANAPGRLPLG